MKIFVVFWHSFPLLTHEHLTWAQLIRTSGRKNVEKETSETC
jgi:hypothetical protein